ncbi:MAG TPA: hypothetical protein DDZ51_19710 [Planctomycetaceae bacterium]|nr:hypothetical protein [Planctomycetaceae bacterium]
MSKQLKMFLMIAVAGSVISSASLAEAGKIRSTAERRQSPDKGFWDSSHDPVVRHQDTHHQEGQPFSFLHQQKIYRPAPKKSNASWGWQRSIQDRRQRPGGR